MKFREVSTFSGVYNIVKEDQVQDLLAEIGLQCSDTYSVESLEQAMIAYLKEHSRPGCDCDESCTDNDCPKVNSDFDHWRQ